MEANHTHPQLLPYSTYSSQTMNGQFGSLLTHREAEMPPLPQWPVLDLQIIVGITQNVVQITPN